MVAELLGGRVVQLGCGRSAKCGPVRETGGIYHLCEVFFDLNLTPALVNQVIWCGGLYASSALVVLVASGSSFP